MLYIILISFCISLVSGRAPLVSLTVSQLRNNTRQNLVTFDNSDYTYPLPETSLSSLGFSGRLYIPSVTCTQSLLPGYSGNITDGVILLPYRYCRDEWEQILHRESLAGRASGCLLYSMKSDAAQAAERIGVQSRSYLGMPVWVVNYVVGEYLVEHLSNNLAVEIRRTALDVGVDDRNFFLKAMVGVGITGIVCFFIALGVRYFDCIQRRRRVPLVHWEARPPEKRVLLREELERMQCKVVTSNTLTEPPRVYQRGNGSCPELVTKRANGLRRSSSLQSTVNGWEETTECAICLESVGVGDVVRELSCCRHVFHRICIDKWLLTQSCMCPLCKRCTLK